MSGAKSVPEARAILERQTVDLIVLDWMLPGVNGLDFVKELRSDPGHRDVMILMATGKGMARDFDQAMFLVGGCVEGSGVRVKDTLDSPNFAPHPATLELVEWLARHGGSNEIKESAQRARTIYRDWLAANKGKVEEQMRLFDLEG